jgi:GxxExxY protein
MLQMKTNVTDVGKVVTPYDELTYKIIGLAMAIHNELGPGLPEKIYQNALLIAMSEDGLKYDNEFIVQVHFRGKFVGEFRLDVVVEKLIVVETKAVSELVMAHEHQTVAYLAASGLPIGLLINFGPVKLEFKRLFPPRSTQRKRV